MGYKKRLKNSNKTKINYRLYKAKKQWIIGCTAVLATLTLGYTNVYANSEPMDNHMTQENSLPDESYVQDKNSGTTTLNTSSDNRSESVLQSEREYDENKSQERQTSNNSANTETVFGSDIDPKNYQVHLNVPGLSYEIPPYQLVNGDLRFATDEEVSHISHWHQPALVNGRAVNVGKYLVFISKTGYENIKAWLNGTKENGKWVPQPDVHNIALPPYNLQTLINMGVATYNITPYKVKVELTGEAPLTTNGLDLNKYSLNLSSNAADQKPATQWNDKFNQYFQLQPGDLQVGTTPTSPNHYPVTLTEQGWNNVLVAIQKVFDSYGEHLDHEPNFICDRDKDVTSSATATLSNEQKTITRTINVYRPGESTPTTSNQEVKITRSSSVGENGELIWGEWSTAIWPSFSAPYVKGYRADPQKVNEATVTYETPDVTVNIHYSKLPDISVSDTKTITETIHYRYSDGTKADDDKVVSIQFTRTGQQDPATDDITWNTWQPADSQTFPAVVSPTIKGYTPDRAHIDEQTVQPTSGNLDFTVTYTKLPDKAVSDTKTITETIHYRYADGSQAAPDKVVKITYVRQGSQDQATDEITWGAWTPAGEQVFPEVVSPVIDGYTADQLSIAAQTVDVDSTDLKFVVTYTKNPGQPGSGSGSQTGNGQLTHSGSTTGQNGKHTEQLPQTGNDANATSISGLAVLSVAAMLGVAKKKRRRQ